MSLATAFLRRDWLRLASYRIGLAGQVIGLALFIGIVFLIGSTLGDASPLGGNGPEYVKFVLAGMAFTDTLMTALHSFPTSVRDAQVAGTLESMLLAPIRAWQLVLVSSVFPFVQSCVRFSIVVAISAVALGYWHQANVITVLLVFVPGSVVFASLGLFSAAFVLAFKQGDPVMAIFGMLSWLLGGAFIPVAVLPAWLQPLSGLLPLTYALSGMRLGLDGAAPEAVIGHVLVLSAIALVTLPIAFAAFRAGLGRAQREGSLVQY